MTTHANRISRAIQTLMLPLALLFLFTGCATAVRSTATQPLTAQQIAELWVDPGDITSRDLFNGPGGTAGAPDPQATYKVTGVDVTGYSAGYDVVDPQGREWKVKLGNEVQPEIVSSRILWAIGFHQPATYYVNQLSLEGGKPEHQGRAARLRAEEGYKTEGTWSWNVNPYVGTQPFKGLLVANLIVNNWDLKETNNRIYLFAEGAPTPRRRFVVQDLGASLGRTRWPVGNRNDPDAFESQKLIDKATNGVVDFDYHARHDELFRDITPADVVWACRLLSRMTDEQWNAAFRAANYSDVVAQRFITKLKSKIEEGLALEKQASAEQ